MHVLRTSFFDGMTPEEVAAVMAELPRREYQPGETVVKEGDRRHQILIIQAGDADVYLTDSSGRDRLVNHLEAGSVIGEMSLFTDQPASATVRAVGILEVLVLGEADFHRVALVHPHIYRNVGAILSEKLAHSDRRLSDVVEDRLVLLRDLGAPPALGFALACSLAWHTRQSVLHLVLTDGDHDKERFGVPPPADPLSIRGIPGRAQHLVAAPVEEYGSRALATTLDNLRRHFDYVLVQVCSELALPRLSARTLYLASPDDTSIPTSREPRAYLLRGWEESKRRSFPDGNGVLLVPPLRGDDEQGMRLGALATSTAAGKALGWMARDISHRKVGLALGAGSAKGYGHIGVLRALQRVGLPVDYVAGTSIGGCVAAMYASNFAADDIALALDEVGRSVWRLTVSTTSLLSNANLRLHLQRIFGDRCIEELPRPLAVIAADILTQQEIIFRRGLIWPVLLATTSIPGIFPPQCIGPYVLVDGGIVNPIPSNVALQMGADMVIGVRLARRGVPASVEEEGRVAGGSAPPLYQTILQSIDVMQTRITTAAAGVASIQLNLDFTDTPDPGIRRFTEGRRFIELGERAAEEAFPRLTTAFPWLTW